jgi:hypothetical protein
MSTTMRMWIAGHGRLVALVALLAAGGAGAEVTGTCVRADVPNPVVLPDGTAHPAGQLRICLSGRFSPVAGLHRTYVNGRFAGMFLSRRVTSEGPVDEHEPFMLFRRNAAGPWELYGYALPHGEGLVSYRMDTIGKSKGQEKRRWIADTGPPPETPGSGWVVLLASGPH